MSKPVITVVVRTLASERRKQLLARALASITEQQDGLARPLVVVNGARYEARLLAGLQERSDIDLLYHPEGNVAAALRAGRQRVATPFFCTLDDDDELLPHALPARLDRLRAQDADLVVTNGYYDDGRTAPRLQYQRFEQLARDPLRSVLMEPWLQSINALYRSDRVAAADLDGMPNYLEWTWLALKLARSRKVAFLDRPTYRLNRASRDSLSFSKEYETGVPFAIRAMLALDLPNDVKRALRKRLSQSLHHASDLARRSGDYRRAWRSHLASLGVGPSWEWVFYTRHLLPRPLVKRAETRQSRSGAD